MTNENKNKKAMIGKLVYQGGMNTVTFNVTSTLNPDIYQKLYDDSIRLKENHPDLYIPIFAKEYLSHGYVSVTGVLPRSIRTKMTLDRNELYSFHFNLYKFEKSMKIVFTSIKEYNTDPNLEEVKLQQILSF